MSELEKNGDWINERWTRIPIELLADQRLTFRHIKVLLALALSRNEKAHQCNPSREALANLSGIHVTHISRTTKELCEFGWISKKGNGGKNMRSNYRLLNPSTHTRAESATHTRAESATHTRAESATQTRAESATQTRAESARRKEQEKEQQKEQYAGAILADLGVSKNIIEDFIALRKHKRAPITGTAIEGIKREAAKAGCTFADAIRTCCEHGWAGFKAEWVLSKGAGYQAKQQPKPWFMTSTGIEKKGEELGIQMRDDNNFQLFRARVYQAEGVTDEMVRKEQMEARA